jgi:hypothetical protein
MNKLQRWFLVAGLILLAIGFAFCCLEYRVVRSDSAEAVALIILSRVSDSDREAVKAQLEDSPEGRATIPLIDLGESYEEEVDLSSIDREAARQPSGKLPTADELWNTAHRPLKQVTLFKGIYARPGMTNLEATLGGMLAPILLLLSAGYFALGLKVAGRTRTEAS